VNWGENKLQGEVSRKILKKNGRTDRGDKGKQRGKSAALSGERESREKNGMSHSC